MRKIQQQAHYSQKIAHTIMLKCIMRVRATSGGGLRLSVFDMPRDKYIRVTCPWGRLLGLSKKAKSGYRDPPNET